MRRCSIVFAGLLAATSATADEESYIRVVLAGGGEVHEYRLTPRTLTLSPASRCPGAVRANCAFFTDPIYQADASERKNIDENILPRLTEQSFFKRASADSQLQRAVITDFSSGKPYRFEVRNLKTQVIELHATTKRAISAAEMLGNRGCVLLLTSTYRNGRMPWDALFAVAGHPTQYDTYYLEVYSPDGNLLKELLVHEDIKNSYGYFLPHLAHQPDARLGSNGPC